MRALRILTFLVFSSFTFVGAAEVIVSYGGGDYIQIDSHNINKQPFALKVEFNKTTPELLHFQVYVEPKEAELSGLRGAMLSVISGKTQIAYVEVKQSIHNKGFVYEFTVSKKYLARSRFSITFVTRENLPYAEDNYYFLLKDFAKEK